VKGEGSEGKRIGSLGSIGQEGLGRTGGLGRSSWVESWKIRRQKDFGLTELENVGQSPPAVFGAAPLALLDQDFHALVAPGVLLVE